MNSKMTTTASTRPENTNGYRPQTAANTRKPNNDVAEEAYDWDAEEDSPNLKPSVKQAFGMPKNNQ